MSQPNQPQTPTNAQLAAIIKQLQLRNDDAPQEVQLITGLLESILHLLEEIHMTLSEPASRLAPLPAAPQVPVAVAPPPPGAAVRDFIAESIVKATDDSGKPLFKIKGFPFVEYGVRVWPEVLPILGINPGDLHPGPNPAPAGMIVRALLADNGSPRKIIGFGDGAAMGEPMGRSNSPSSPPEPDFPDDLPF